MRVSSSSIISGSAKPNVPAARERRAGTNCMCKIWFVSHPIEKFRNERSAAMNIAVAAITLNIFSPFILFYFFALAAVALLAASARTALPAGLEFDSLNLKGIQLGCSKVGLLAKSYVAYALYIHLFKL